MEPTLRTLGKTEIRITPIGLGVWQFSQGRGAATSIWSALEEEASNRIVEAALEGGINWFDTAEIYGNGRSEHALAQALKAAGAHKDDVVPSQVALSWLVNFHGESVVAIPGASKPKHAEESAGAMRLVISDEDMARLDAATSAF